MPTTLTLRLRRMRLWNPCAALLLLAALTPSCMVGQSESASVSGRVTDQQNAVIPNVEVEIRNVDTNSTEITKTNGEGIYSFPSLKPGNYVMSVRKEQFQTVSVTGITLHVQDSLSRNFALQVGSAAVSITVNASDLHINTTDASVSTVIDRQFVENLPLNGRTFNTLLQLTPGVVIAQQSFQSASVSGNASSGQFSVAGQRTNANSFSVDGVSANFGISPNVGNSGTGSGQAFSVLGGTNSLVSVDALQEFRVETSSFAPEFGRSPGGQVILTTRSGTNAFHGGVFDYFRNTAMDANDWFANQAKQPRAPEHHNDFGGFLGGPIWRDKTFFFFSYEGARLDLPQTLLTAVPSVFARTNAPPAVAPYLDAYPLPDDRTITPGVFTSRLTDTFSNSATLNATSIRIDHNFNDRFSIFGRYNDAPSGITNRPVAVANDVTINTRTVTAGANMFLSGRASNTLRGNYSTQSTGNSFGLTSFGGAVPINPTLLLGSLPAANTLASFQTSDAGLYQIGQASRLHTTQLNFVDDLAITTGTHQLKVGGDYRAIFFDPNEARFTPSFAASSVQSFISTGMAFVSVGINVPAQVLAQSFSLYGQDTWKVTSRLTLTYGLRWELAPSPSARDNARLAAWENVNNPSQVALAPQGTPVWNTTYGNFAPRIGLAYSLTQKGDFVVRAGWGLFYDVGAGQSSGALATQFPHSAFTLAGNQSLPVSDLTPFVPSVSLQPPFGFVIAYDPNLKVPRSYQWNVALEKSIGGKQVISATYVGQAGRDLLRQEVLFQPNANFSSAFQLTQNTARSNYNALQLQYRRPLSSRLQALLNYTWSHSLDNASDDQIEAVSHTVLSAARDYGSSNFDVRQSFSGAVTYSVPAAAKSGPVSWLTRDWFLDTVIVARSGFPFSGVVLGLSPEGLTYSRPDRVPGKPLYLSASQCASIVGTGCPGGKGLNPAAFAVPSTVRQGTEGRNDIPGLGLVQADLSVSRKFSITERLKLQFRTDAFNVFNHPNFANPFGSVQFFPFFGMTSSQMLNQGLGGLNPLFQEGGPRSLQLSLRLTF